MPLLPPHLCGGCCLAPFGLVVPASLWWLSLDSPSILPRLAQFSLRREGRPPDLPLDTPAPMSPGPDEGGAEVPQMDPAILIFLLYLMIIHELVSGWMEYQKQATKPKKQTGPLWSSSCSRMSRSGFSQPLASSTRRERHREWRKPGRILRKV